MKTCAYCGRENEETAESCMDCGTSLVVIPSGKISDVLNWSPRSALSAAICTGVAALLFSTGAYWLLGKGLLDFLKAFYPNSVPRGLSDSSPMSMIMPRSLEAIIGAGAMAFTIAMCALRCWKRSHAVVISAVVICLLLLFKAIPEVGFYLTPAAMLGVGTMSSIIFYIAAAAQVGIAGWLVGWFRRNKGSEAG